jgi:uncharacterized protein YkwD
VPYPAVMARRILFAALGVALLVGAVVAVLVGLRPVEATPSTTATASLSRIATEAVRPTATAAPPAAPTESAPPPPAEEPEPAPPPPAPAPPAGDPMEGEVLALVNGERAANGCPPLTADEGLASVAREHSADMAARDYFAHDTPEGVDPFERAAAAGQSARAENIAAGYATPAEVVAGWMASPGHRANLLNCGLSRVGTGVGHGGSYGITWTQLFG